MQCEPMGARKRWPRELCRANRQRAKGYRKVLNALEFGRRGTRGSGTRGLTRNPFASWTLFQSGVFQVLGEARASVLTPTPY